MALTKITATNLSANAVTANSIGYTPANKAGDIFTGQIMIENQAESGYANNLAESVTRAVVKMKPHNGDSTLTTFGSLANGVAGSASLGNGYIQRSNGPGTGTYHMYLNPFGGAVLTPSQPLFIGTHTNQYVTSFTSNSVIPVSTVYYNIGSCYNSSTYKFTCPVAGYYEVKMQDITQGNVASSIGFTVNGSLAFKAYTEDRDKHCFATWYCNVNDYIEFRVMEGPTTLFGSSGYAFYSVRLVG